MSKTLLQINSTANWGSTGRIAEGIGLAAMARGWKSAIAYGRSMNQSQSQLVKVGNQLDVYAHYAQHRLFDREGLGSTRPTKRLIKWIDSYRPDIIHLHNIHDHWLNYPLLFQYLATIDTPIVWTFHDCWAFTGGCAYFELSQCIKWQLGCNNCPQKSNAIDKSSRNQSLKAEYINKIKSHLTVVSVSKWLNDKVSKSLIKPSLQRVIYNGVDVNIFKPTSSSLGYKGKKIILGVANVWGATKGLNSYFQLRKLLNDRYLIILVGLEKKTINSLPKGIIGISRTQNLTELAKLYTRADVLVSLSIQETFGMTLAESFACGTPAIAYDVTALPEVISPNTGIVVPKGNLKAVAEAIEIICSSDSSFKEVCRARADIYFNKDIQFNKYIELYENLLAIDNQVAPPRLTVWITAICNKILTERRAA